MYENRDGDVYRDYKQTDSSSRGLSHNVPQDDADEEFIKSIPKTTALHILKMLVEEGQTYDYNKRSNTSE